MAQSHVICKPAQILNGGQYDVETTDRTTYFSNNSFHKKNNGISYQELLPIGTLENWNQVFIVNAPETKSVVLKKGRRITMYSLMCSFGNYFTSVHVSMLKQMKQMRKSYETAHK